MKVVALGGGHGLAATLAALRQFCPQVTAVVTVADDGGSSGRIRRELGALPPGDLRMALTALAQDGPAGPVWAGLLPHRFGGSGALAGHPVGNLMITGLAEVLGDPVAALDQVARLVGAVGRVLPMSTIPLEIAAEVVGIDRDDPDRVRRIRGQVAVATTPGRVVSVSLMPKAPPACPEAVAAIRAADAVVLGPGSWFTSVLPHVLVPDLLAALVQTTARRIVALNLAPQPGETDGFSPEQHLDVLCAHAPGLQVDAVVADTDAVVDTRGLMSAVAALGAELVLAPVAAGDGTPRHDPERLAVAFRQAFAAGGAPAGRAAAGGPAASGPPAGSAAGGKPAGSGSGTGGDGDAGEGGVASGWR
ncbi:MAG TPA: uridine diphosphate-N-acetylglucosamine-binding protein YvcK [Mycobacteriales bacterium]|nr:uridine diphosphate-N-acetylglucosamine-binding protein YvcK [Mycobacteriales bacterium]